MLDIYIYTGAAGRQLLPIPPLTPLLSLPSPGSVSLCLSLSQGLDSTSTTFSAAGTFCTGTAGSSGAKVVVGVLVRLESNEQAGAYRVTVRAQHAVVALAIVTSLKTQL